jgi:hypothetical protein
MSWAWQACEVVRLRGPHRGQGVIAALSIFDDAEPDSLGRGTPRDGGARSRSPFRGSEFYHPEPTTSSNRPMLIKCTLCRMQTHMRFDACDVPRTELEDQSTLTEQRDPVLPLSNLVRGDDLAL